MTARFRVSGSFALRSRSLFVVVGAIESGTVRIGQSVRKPAELNASVHGVEFVLRSAGGREEEPALTFRYSDESQLVQWETTCPTGTELELAEPQETRSRGPLPSEAQREQLAILIHDALVEIRALGAQGRATQAADLADAIHNLPREIYGWGSWSQAITRGMLEVYQQKYHHEDYLGKRDYVAMFDRIFEPP